MTLITPDTWDLLRAADLAKKGSWPVSGGWLEQTESCLEGVQLVWNFEDRCKNRVIEDV